MIEATSCGGVVIFRGKILLLYKNYRNKYEGWVLPKGTVEAGEEYKDTAAREVREETGVDASSYQICGERASIHLLFLRIQWKNRCHLVSDDGRQLITVNRSAKRYFVDFAGY